MYFYVVFYLGFVVFFPFLFLELPPFRTLHVKHKILPKELTNGLAIESINIDAVDINFHKVSLDSVAQVLSDGFSGYSYYVRNIPEYAELVYTARYSINVTNNKKMTVNLPIHKVKQLNLIFQKFNIV